MADQKRSGARREQGRSREQTLQVQVGHSRGGSERLRIPSGVGRESVATILCFAQSLQRGLRVNSSRHASDRAGLQVGRRGRSTTRSTRRSSDGHSPELHETWSDPETKTHQAGWMGQWSGAGGMRAYSRLALGNRLGNLPCLSEMIKGACRTNPQDVVKPWVTAGQNGLDHRRCEEYQSRKFPR